MPFHEALDARAVKQLLPTELRTKMLDTIPAELRERAMFSAGVTNTELLQRIDDSINDLVSGQVDRATKRAGLKQLVARLDLGAKADDERGTLTDLGSDRRLNLILDTNLQQAQGYGHWMQGQDAAVLDQWPAQELVRVIDSREKRDWAARWAAAGGQFFDGRMVALKNDPLWSRLSRFGTPYPPFDFNSGMDVQDIDRGEAEDLGLIDRDTELFPQDRDFNTDLAATPEVRDASLRDALAESLAGRARFDAGGVLRLVGRVLGAANVRDYARDELGRFATDGGGLSVADNLARGQKAIAKLRRDQGGTVEVAMQVPGLGDVEFPWGRAGHTRPNAAGKTHTDGYGLSHIEAKHGRAAADALPETIAKGKITAHPHDPQKREITHGKYKAVVGKTKKPAAWVITNYEEHR
ncbi:MAG: hypothetical protein HZA93_23845 [Verrucomicrobia bacterium]|nr:hypothetical protein [Verrucomicrobiota bacterium]